MSSNSNFLSLSPSPMPWSPFYPSLRAVPRTFPLSSPDHVPVLSPNTNFRRIFGGTPPFPRAPVRPNPPRAPLRDRAPTQLFINTTSSAPSSSRSRVHAYASSTSDSDSDSFIDPFAPPSSVPTDVSPTPHPCPPSPSIQPRTPSIRPRITSPSPRPSLFAPQTTGRTRAPRISHFAQVAENLFMAPQVPGQPPPSMLWTDATWGNWATRDFTHRIVLVSETDVRALHARRGGCGGGALLDACEGAVGTVRELRLVIPEVAAGERRVALADRQLDAAFEFLERAYAYSAFDSDSEDEDEVRTASPAKRRRIAKEPRPRCTLVSCPEGYEVNAVAIVVGFLAAWHREGLWEVCRRVKENPDVQDAWKGKLTLEDAALVAKVAGLDLAKECFV